MARFDRLSRFYDLLPVPTHAQALNQRLHHVPAPRLDLGGGTGKHTVRIHGNDGAAVVLDLSRGMLEKGLWSGRAFHAVQGAAQHLPFPEETFHAVTITEAFHHFGVEQEAVLDEARRVLRPDGRLLVEEIDPEHLLGQVIVFGEHALGMGSRFRTREKMEALVEARFQEVEVERTGLFTYLVEGRGPREAPAPQESEPQRT